MTHPGPDPLLFGTDVPSLVPIEDAVEPVNYEADERDDGDDFVPEEADLSGLPLAQAETLRAFSAPTGGTHDSIKQMLENLGWRIRTSGELKQAIHNFQAAVILDGELKVDGIAGPKTTAKLHLCEARRKAGLPTASDHFSFTEFRCKCNGKFSACARIWIKRRVIHELESYRKHLGHGVKIISGCRCVGHNKAVGGATKSQHMRGDAADFPPAKSTAWFFIRSLFDGRGFNPKHLVRHGDMRGSSAVWRYGS